MARIIKHPAVEDYFVELSLDEVRANPNGITEAYEDNQLIILRDYRLPVDLGIFAEMSTNLQRVEDRQIQRKIKKLVATAFFGEGQSGGDFRRALFEVLCNGDSALFERVCIEMKRAHDAVLELYKICFPSYGGYSRIIPSVRLTQTLFENLHWDNHQIDDDFQQVRIFCNLDQRPRIWSASHNFTTYARQLYAQHDLGRFAGKDPNLLNNYICGAVLGGTANACLEPLPRHVIAFEPGEVWFGESRLLAHQIIYGERAMVYMFFAPPEAMLHPERRFNAQVEGLHREFARKIPADV